MRNLLIVLAALAIMVLGVYGSAVILFDQERIKAIIAEQIEQQTGRRVEIQGEVRLRLFPGLRISAQRVVMRGPAGFEGPDLFEADQLDAQVRLLPLIRGRIDPTVIRVDGVRLNLHEDRDGVNSLDGLLHLIGSDGPDPTGAGASVSLENVTVTMGRGEQDLRESFEVERMDVDGFAFGQPLQFRFRGSVGEPALFDYLEVDGVLVSTEADRLRLSNMRLAGMVDQGRYDLELLGNVNLALGESLSFSVDGGNLNFNQHQFDLNMRYAGGDRPSFSARLSSELVDVDVLQVLERMAMVPYLPEDSGVMTGLRGMDFDVQLDIEHVATLGLTVDSLDMLVTGREGLVHIQTLTGKVPGATVAGGGELDLRVFEPDWTMDLSLDVMELGSLLTAMRLDWPVNAAGTLEMDLSSSRHQSVPATGAWTGMAKVELIDGTWPLLEILSAGLPESRSDGQFEFLSSTLAIKPDRLQLSDLHLVTPNLIVEGALSMTLPDATLTGRLELLGEAGSVQAQLSGTLDQPEATYSPVVMRPAQ
jgi:AsmA protein